MTSETRPMLDLTLAEVDRIDAAARANANDVDCRDTVLLCAGFRALTQERDRLQKITDMEGTELVAMTYRVEQAEAERDAARAALELCLESGMQPFLEKKIRTALGEGA